MRLIDVEGLGEVADEASSTSACEACDALLDAAEDTALLAIWFRATTAVNLVIKPPFGGALPPTPPTPLGVALTTRFVELVLLASILLSSTFEVRTTTSRELGGGRDNKL